MIANSGDESKSFFCESVCFIFSDLVCQRSITLLESEER